MRESKGREVVFRADPLNEQAVLAWSLVGADFRKSMAGQPPDVFLVEEHRVIWAAVREAVRQQIEPVPATLSRLSNGAVDARYVAELLAGYPDVPDERTRAHAVAQLLWDRQKYVAVTGPIDALLDAIGKNEEPERVRGLASAVSSSFDGWGDRRYLHDPVEIVRAQMADVRNRMSGRAVYPFGLKGFDFVLDGQSSGERRIVPGAAPGQVTVVTGCPGTGKSTTSARLVLGLARQGRRVLYGAWEMRGGTTLELIACQSLAEKDTPPGDWSRKKLSTPSDYPGWMTDERLAVLESTMASLAGRIRFLANPFRRKSGEKRSNERNLDVVAGYVADSGCDVFVADLWKRCLAETRPEDEEEALYRQQAMAEELGVHCILIQQQRMKDIETRPDKRPTREGIKGSGAWTEIADTIIGTHRPALWKPVPDNVLELDVLKQRYGRWPIAIEFDWEPDAGVIRGGVTVEYDVAASRGETTNSIDAAIREPKAGGGKRR